jgi:predicted ATPase/DNA-binding CsgD family transcriptional regulator
VAAALHKSFSGGAYFVSLAPLSNPDLVLSTIAQTLGVHEVPGQIILQSLCAALRDRHTLLILDNFEQLLGLKPDSVSAGPQLLELLQCAPRLQVLVTSRSALRVYGEQEYQVLPLSLPDASQGESPVQLAKYEAIRLFIERARAVKPGFDITKSSAPVVAEICRRLDGLPLAIELAAARIKLLSPRALLKRLDQRLPLLTSGATSLPYRHQTLRDAIAWSYDLLSTEEQRLFRSLSVFVGGCTLEAAEAVCAFGRRQRRQRTLNRRQNDNPALSPQPSILDGLAALVDKSLLRQEEQEDGEPRFFMLETIREFALEELVTRGEAEAMRRRHADYFLALAKIAEPGLMGSELTLWLGRLDGDHANLRAALSWLLEQEGAETDESALRLLMDLQGFWDRRTHTSEYERWLERALEQAGPKATPLRSRALRKCGFLAGRYGDYARARACTKQAETIARELGDQRLIADALNNLALVELAVGDCAAGRVLLEGLLALYRELGDDSRIAATLLNLGDASRCLGDYRRAEAFYRESLDLFRTLGEPTGILVSVLNFGQATYHLGNFPEAKGALLEALAIAQETQTARFATGALTSLCSLILTEMDKPSAVVAQDLSSMEQIARLSGLTARLIERSGKLLDPNDQAEYDHNVAAARARLGEEAFTAAWNEGNALTLEDALALALEAPNAHVPGTRAPARAVSRPGIDSSSASSEQALTRREIEVLRLVAVGLTNPEIAEHLTLSIYTVRAHLRSIFGKIDVKTRTAAVHYVFEHNLN